MTLINPFVDEKSLEEEIFEDIDEAEDKSFVESEVLGVCIDYRVPDEDIDPIIWYVAEFEGRGNYDISEDKFKELKETTKKMLKPVIDKYVSEDRNRWKA